MRKPFSYGILKSIHGGKISATGGAYSAGIGGGAEATDQGSLQMGDGVYLMAGADKDSTRRRQAIIRKYLERKTQRLRKLRRFL